MSVKYSYLDNYTYKLYCKYVYNGGRDSILVHNGDYIYIPVDIKTFTDYKYEFTKFYEYAKIKLRKQKLKKLCSKLEIK